MYILLALLLSTTPPSDLCQEIRTVLEEQVEAGLINKQVAEGILSRCAGHLE